MLLDAVFFLARAALDLAFWAIVIAAVLSLLVGFGVLDTRNRAVWTISDLFARVTEPMLRPIRSRIPSINGIDLSPLVALLLIQAVGILLAATQGYMIRGGLYF